MPRWPKDYDRRRANRQGARTCSRGAISGWLIRRAGGKRRPAGLAERAELGALYLTWQT